MRLRSYISSFKALLIKDRLAAFIAFVALFVLMVIGIDRAFTLLRPPSNSVFAIAAEQKQRELSRKLDRGLGAVEAVAIGSSRAQFGFAPDMFRQVAGLTSYNAGIGGYIRTDQHFDVARRILASGTTPKLIIYVVDDIDLNGEPEDSEQVLRIFHSIRVLRGGLVRAIRRMAADGWQIPAFKTVKLDLKDFDHFEGIIVHENGWVEGMGTANPNMLRYEGTSFAPTKASIIFMRRVIELCRSRQTKVVLVQTPVHKNYLDSGQEREKAFLSFMNGIAREYGIPFISFANSQDFPSDDTSLFFDTTHLNSAGAKLFSRKLAERLLTVQGRLSPRAF